MRARAVATLILTSATAAADLPRAHDGLYLRLSLGVAAQQSSFAFADQPTGGAMHRASGVGAAYAAALGGTVARGLVVAGEVSSRGVEAPDTVPGRGSPLAARATSASSLLAVVDWYQWPARGVHLLGGAGVGTVSVELASDAAGDDPRSRAGTAWMFGAGVERFVSDRWSLGVVARFDACLAPDDSGEEGRAGPRFHAAARAATLALSGTLH
ncbi:MAG: hypothetical protein IT374_14245 [Polyangiaceae bacterium]|nr:hypothetical protein [Polyangiaceae bacterium]